MFDHRTGRKCDLCGGVLLDTNIQFGEFLPEDILERASKAAKQADLCLVLGSSLTVTPARDLPETVGRKRRAKLVICNLQETPLDAMSETRIFSETDIVMSKVMDGLGFPIPSFILRRRLVIKHQTTPNNQHQFTLGGIDVDSTPVLFLQSVKLDGYRRVARSDPFQFTLRNALVEGEKMEFTLVFMGHYNEPNVTIVHEYAGDVESQTFFDLQYDPQTGSWTTTKI